MLDGRRKLIQAMAARLPDGNEQCPGAEILLHLPQVPRHSTGLDDGRPEPTRTFLTSALPTKTSKMQLQSESPSSASVKETPIRAQGHEMIAS